MHSDYKPDHTRSMKTKKINQEETLKSFKNIDEQNGILLMKNSKIKNLQLTLMRQDK